MYGLCTWINLESMEGNEVQAKLSLGLDGI